MHWNKTQEFYDAFIREELPTSPYCEVDYESFLLAILADMHMVDLPRQRMNTEEDFIRFSHRAFPEDSEAFAWSRKIIGLKYYAEDKNEFIACYRRNDEKHQIIFRPRAEIEYVPEYVQFVAMAIPFFYVDDVPVFMFIEEHASDMKGTTTMIGGHIQYDGNVNTDSNSFDTVAIQTAKREAMEELGVKEHMLRYISDTKATQANASDNPLGYIKFDTRNRVPKHNISYYHIGYGYTFEVLDYQQTLMSIRMEEGKELLLFTPNREVEIHSIRNYRNKEIPVFNLDTFDREKYHPEPWLMSLIGYMI